MSSRRRVLREGESVRTVPKAEGRSPLDRAETEAEEGRTLLACVQAERLAIEHMSHEVHAALPAFACVGSERQRPSLREKGGESERKRDAPSSCSSSKNLVK